MQEFTSHDVVALTGISPRQLQWWDEQGIVSPARQGRCRLYSFADLTEISVICELRRKGFSLQRVRKVLRFLQRELGKRLVETLSQSADVHLLTDGQRIYLETSARQVIDVLKNARQPLLTICLSDTLRQVRADIRGRDFRNKKSVRSAVWVRSRRKDSA
ncbi:MAG TPA: MerR family transcriptional regulator [Terriglobales bacterium]|jgi:DNA-binding transcriptional MerR regulator|nr:MerR family transcriptional regulator [Terriglobales bacterium]